ncbi:MAG: response regulator [Gemmataceae bacterium]|nr:response regulator [Gemmataceae bacterium]MCI0741348.1 response regulator [Gemmataceae bacterium]
MRWKFNSLLARLLIGTGFPLVLFLAVAMVAGIAIQRLQSVLNEEQASHVFLNSFFELQDRVNQMRLANRGHALGLGLDVKALEHDYMQNRGSFRQIAHALKDKSQNQPEHLRRLDRILEVEAIWHPLMVASILQMAPRPMQTREEFDKIVRDIFGVTNPLMADIQNEIAALIRDEESRLHALRTQVHQQTIESFWLIGITLAAGMGLALFVALRAARSVTRPIDQLRQATKELIGGRFQMLTPNGPAEIGELIVHFNHMGLTLSQMTASLQEQKESYQRYIGATSHILWTTDAAGKVVHDIPGWRHYTGQNEESIRGDGWFDAVHPEDRATLRQAWESAVRERTPFELQYRIRSGQGEYRQFLCRGVPVLLGVNAVREWIGTCTDITESIKEGDLRRAKEAAEASNQAKTEFLAKMSHELRTPLNAVIGMSKMLSTQRFGTLNAKQLDYLQDISRAGEHLLDLINDILDLAKVESGRMEFQAEEFAPGDAVAEVLSTLRPLAEEKNLVVRVEPMDHSAKLVSDPARFRQVLYNLLSNAYKFTAAGGRVTVGGQWVQDATPEASEVAPEQAAALRVFVADTGIGIAPQNQNVIWEEFRQVQGAGAERPQGTGLGLSLTRKLVERMGGKIWLQSQEGIGSTFTFVLPRALMPAAKCETICAAQPPATDSPKPLALVIEDYPATRKLLLDWLNEEGLATAAAADGETGLVMARQLRPNLILLDVLLPGIDGWQVLTALKTQPETASIPVVIVTVTEQFLPAGGLAVREFFVKPLDRDAFVGRLRALEPSLFERGSAHALVVDDDPAARKLLRDLLQEERMHVSESANGQEALAWLETNRPDVIFLDLVMPDLDGFAVAEAVREKSDLQRLPIIVVTAKDLSAEDRARLHGRIQALISKQALSPENLRQELEKFRLHAART